MSDVLTPHPSTPDTAPTPDGAIDPSYPALIGLRRAILAGRIHYREQKQPGLVRKIDFEEDTTFLNEAVIDRTAVPPEPLTPGIEPRPAPKSLAYDPLESHKSRNADIYDRHPELFGLEPNPDRPYRFGDQNVFEPDPLEARNFRERWRSKGKNIALDGVRDRNGKRAKWRRLYGETVTTEDRDTLKRGLKEVDYPRSQRKAALRANKTTARETRRAESNYAYVESTHGRFSRDPSAKHDKLVRKNERDRLRLEELREMAPQARAHKAEKKARNKEARAERQRLRRAHRGQNTPPTP